MRSHGTESNRRRPHRQPRLLDARRASIAYQWQSSPDGSKWSDITGASAQTYTPVATDGDAGQQLRVEVTASNTDGSQLAITPASAPVAQPPLNLDAPAAPTGTLLDSYTLTAENGSWDTPGASFTYVWERCPAQATSITAACTAVGIPSPTYVLQGADVRYRIGVNVTAVSSGGASIPVSSALTAAISGRPLIDTTAPSISGTPQVAQTLHTNPGIWNIPSTLTYVWQRCDADGASNCTPVGSGPAYTLGPADDTHTIILYTTATSPGQTVTVHTPALTIQAQPLPQATLAPAVFGTAARGQPLSASQVGITPGVWTGGPTVGNDTVQIMSCTNVCASAGPANAASYLILTTDLGAILRIRETATNVGGATVVWSARYVGPVISIAAGSSMLKPSASIAVKNTSGQTLATARLHSQPATGDDRPMLAQAASARPGAGRTVRVVTVKRAKGITGPLSAWVCPVPAAGSTTQPKCTTKQRVNAAESAASVKLPASMTGKLRVVVVRR